VKLWDLKDIEKRLEKKKPEKGERKREKMLIE